MTREANSPRPWFKQIRRDNNRLELCLEGRRGATPAFWPVLQPRCKPAACVARIWSSMLNMSTHLLCHQPAAHAVTLMAWQAPLLFSPLLPSAPGFIPPSGPSLLSLHRFVALHPSPVSPPPSDKCRPQPGWGSSGVGSVTLFPLHL